MKLIASLIVVIFTCIASARSIDVLSSNLRKLGSSVVAPQVESGRSVLGEDKCTTIVVGPKAGIEGPMTTHTSDCADCDFRISKVTSLTDIFVTVVI